MTSSCIPWRTGSIVEDEEEGEDDDDSSFSTPRVAATLPSDETGADSFIFSFISGILFGTGPDFVPGFDA